MVSKASIGSFDSHAGEGFEVMSTDYDASSFTITMKYKGTRVILDTENVVFSINKFKNPVNKEKKRGFRISTQDS